jgi:hypothetical protein
MDPGFHPQQQIIRQNSLEERWQLFEVEGAPGHRMASAKVRRYVAIGSVSPV